MGVSPGGWPPPLGQVGLGSSRAAALGPRSSQELWLRPPYDFICAVPSQQGFEPLLPWILEGFRLSLISHLMN